MEHKYIAELTLDYCGYPDYYQGHGHPMHSVTKACVVFSFPIEYTETVDMIREAIESDLQNSDICFINTISKIEERKISSEYDDLAKDAIQEEFEKIANSGDEYFFGEDERTISSGEEDELPVLTGYIHIYKKN